MNGYRPLIIIWLAFAVNVGCHYRDPSVDLLEGELRYMEDQVYALEDELYRRCMQLDACRSRTAQRDSCEELSGGNTGSSHSYSDAEPLPIPMPGDDRRQEPVPAVPDYQLVEPMPSYEEQPAVEMPVITDSDDDEDALDTLPQEPVPAKSDPIPAKPEPSANEYEILDPQIEIPSSAESGFEILDPDVPPAELPAGSPPILESDDAEIQPSDADPGRAVDDDTAISLNFRSTDDSSSETSQASHEAHVDAHVTHIVANAELVTERGFDDELTNADILVVVEPRNKNGRYVELTGPVSVVVLDANKTGPSARIARWDYDAGSARRAIRKSALGSGIHLELNWPEGPPASENLHLFVRYTTIEDRNLETDTRLETNPDREMYRGWQVVDRPPRPERRSDGSSGWSATSSSTTEAAPRELPPPLLNGFKMRPIEESAAMTTASERVANSSSTPVAESPSEPRSTPEWSPFR